MIDIHLHGNFDGLEKTLKKVLAGQKHLHEDLILILKNMPTKQEFQTALDEMSASITNIADDIQRLTEQIGQGGLSEADEADVLSQIQAKAAQLRSIADQTPEPTPEE